MARLKRRLSCSGRLSPPRFPSSRRGGRLAGGSSPRFLLPIDRCGDVALSRAGPKPRQPRDGHSLVNGTALLALPAGPSPLLPVRRRCVEGKGCGTRPDLGVTPVVSVTQRTPSARLSRLALSRAPFPAAGRGCPVVAPHVPPRWACGRCFALALGGCPWSAPGRPAGARGRAGGVVSRSPRAPPSGPPLSAVRWRASPAGESGRVRGRHARPPRGRGAGPSQRVPRGRPRRGRVSGCRPLADRESWIFFAAACSSVTVDFFFFLSPASCRCSRRNTAGSLLVNCGRRPPVEARGRRPEAARARSSRALALSLSRRPLSRALVCVFTLCFDPDPVGSSPGPPPCSLGSVSSWLRGPGGVFLLGLGDDTPSVRKPSLAIREGALGYRTPQPPPLLWKRVRFAAPVLVRSGPSRTGFERPSGDAAVPYRGPRLPPPSRGRVPPGRGRRPSRGSALRLRERAHARVAACASGRAGVKFPPVACRRGWGGAAEAFPRPPAFPLPRLEPALRPLPPHGFAADGCAARARTGPACPRGALRPGRESPSGSDWADERMGGWRGSRGGSPVVAEGRVCE